MTTLERGFPSSARRDTGFDRGVNGRDAFSLVRWAVGSGRHAHAAETKRRNDRSVPAKRSCLHSVCS
jgi:hypothetical protein